MVLARQRKNTLLFFYNNYKIKIVFVKFYKIIFALRWPDISQMTILEKGQLWLEKVSGTITVSQSFWAFHKFNHTTNSHAYG